MKPLPNNRPPKKGGSVPGLHGLNPAARAAKDARRYTKSGSTKAVPPQKRQPQSTPPKAKVQSAVKAPSTPQTRPVRRARRRPLTPKERAIRYLKKKLAAIPYLLPEGETLGKALISAGLILLFVLLQTTVFARFRPFGAIPDLILPLIVALSLTEGEKWGAVCGLAAAFVIESVGSSGVTLLPILYAAVGYLCPIITREHMTDSVPVRVLLTAVTGVARAVFTLIYLGIHADPFRFFPLCGSIVLPEYAATFVLALLPHLAVYLCLHPFHKSRAERTETL